MTKGELWDIEKRIKEIDQIFDICDENKNADIIDNLTKELDNIIFLLENSERKAKIKENGFNLIKCG